MHFAKVKGILSAKNGMNIYRGCTHGCIYCDARSKCYKFTHEFEDIEVKSNAALLLENSLRSKRKKCMIGTGAMSDPYMHCEDDIKLTRRCLEIIDKYGFGLSIQTKSNKILRDLDLLKSINEKSKCVVQMTLTTFNENLCKIIEPNVSTTKERFETLKILRNNGIQTVVWLSPILPFINDTKENLYGILDYCFQAKVYGIICFGMGVTLREGSREYFYEKLDQHFSELRSKYMNKFGYSYDCKSENNNVLMKIFRDECKKRGIETDINKLFTYLQDFSEKSSYEQLSLF